VLLILLILLLFVTGTSPRPLRGVDGVAVVNCMIGFGFQASTEMVRKPDADAAMHQSNSPLIADCEERAQQ
jgi:hypothetical protein